jgi:transcription elongation factor GreA
VADNIPITKAGTEAIKRELKYIKSVERPKNVQDISTARDHGDLRENAEYHAAKEKQSHLAGRIQQLEDWLARAEIIDVAKISGATVTLEQAETGHKLQYVIVGEPEADIKKGRISVTSPVARGLIGREVGDEVKIPAPGGQKTYEVLKVEFLEYTVEAEHEA